VPGLFVGTVELALGIGRKVLLVVGVVWLPGGRKVLWVDGSEVGEAVVTASHTIGSC